MNESLLALIVLIGVQEEDWAFMEIDQIEWTTSKYNHQN